MVQAVGSDALRRTHGSYLEAPDCRKAHQTLPAFLSANKGSHSHSETARRRRRRRSSSSSVAFPFIPIMRRGCFFPSALAGDITFLLRNPPVLHLLGSHLQGFSFDVLPWAELQTQRPAQELGKDFTDDEVLQHLSRRDLARSPILPPGPPADLGKVYSQLEPGHP